MLWMVKPQTAPTRAASTVMTSMTGSRWRQSARVLSAQTAADGDQRDQRRGVLGPQHRAEQRDQHEGPRARQLSRTCWRSRPQRAHLLKLSMMLSTAGPMTAMNRVGRMQKISGMVIFTGTCWAFSSARWRRLTRISADCTRSTWAIGDAEGVGLHHGADEGADVGDVGALAQRAQRVGAALADLHLAQHAGELLGQRALGVAGHLLDRGVEAEAGLDADGEQVDGVGEVALQLLGRARGPAGRGTGSGRRSRRRCRPR